MVKNQKTRATVGAIIHKNDGPIDAKCMTPKASSESASSKSILLVKRGTEPFKDYWAIPGGHIDFGETAEQAVIRETKEETGLEIKPRFFRYFDEIIDDYDWHSVVLMFSCDFSGKISFDKKEITDLKWFSYGEIKGLKMAFRHKEILDEWIKSQENR